MASRQAKPIVAFDLDGVLVDKPPFMPKKVLEWLFRGRKKDRLHYRFPPRWEQFVRQLAHFYLLRPPIKQNIRFLHKLNRQQKYRLILISSRYSFLQTQTKQWLKKRRVDRCFDQIYLNTKDKQPHLFKEKKLGQLKPKVYFEDDQLIVNYLRQKLPRTKIVFATAKKPLPPLPS